MENSKVRCLRYLRGVAFVMMATFVFTGCGSHMKNMTIVGDDMKNISGAREVGTDESEVLPFAPYRVIKIEMPKAAFFSEGIFGGNYFVGLQKADAEAKHMPNIKKSADLLKAEIVVEQGIPYLYLFDYEKKIDLDRKILVQTRVVPGHQHSIGGEFICGQGMRKLDWELFKSTNEYVQDGLVAITDVDNSDEIAHTDTVKLITRIIQRYQEYDQDSSFERFLKGFGRLSSTEIHFMIAGTINPIQVYPMIGAKLFDIMRALSGEVDTNQPGYETSVLTAFQQGIAFDRYFKLMKAKIQNDIYLENREENINLAGIKMQELLFWKNNEIEKIQDWKKICFEVLSIDSTNVNGMSQLDRESVASIEARADKYVQYIEQRYSKRAAYYGQLNE
jgi:hypothetical protein